MRPNTGIQASISGATDRIVMVSKYSGKQAVIGYGEVIHRACYGVPGEVILISDSRLGYIELIPDAILRT